MYPHILYGVEVYANTSMSKLDKLCKLNNKLIRILFNKKLNTLVLELYKCINALPITELHEMQLLLFVHRCLYHNEQLPEVFHNYFVKMPSVHCHNTRRNLGIGLHVPGCKASLGQRCTLYKCTRLWNMIPIDLKVCSSLLFLRGI